MLLGAESQFVSTADLLGRPEPLESQAETRLDLNKDNFQNAKRISRQGKWLTEIKYDHNFPI